MTRLLCVLSVILCAWSASAQTAVDTIPRPVDNADVSLRDYTSTRIDQMQTIMDERDRQYAQRFEAQQQALKDTLASAKESVTKAEESLNKRFDSVNEFRQTLTDQANTFMSKAEADARLKAVEEDISRITSRSEGASNLWIVLVAAFLVVLNLAGLLINFSKRKE